jgi:adenosylcobinamide-GDP ribazoletransferase
MKNVLVAFVLLTIGNRFNALPISPQEIASAAHYFPLVGVLLGLVLALLNQLLEPYLASEILAVVLIAVSILLTGALHLEGTQKSLDTPVVTIDGEKASPSSVGIYGLIALFLVVLVKIRSVEVIGETRSLALLLTPVLARWSLVIFLYGATPAANNSPKDVGKRLRTWHLLLTTFGTLALSVYFTGRTGLWIGLYLSLLALLSRGYFHRRYGGYTYNNLGAVIELGEILSFIYFASL